MYEYAERMLQSSDELKAHEWDGKFRQKRQGMHKGREAIWLECATLEEFASRANLSTHRAKVLNKHFASLSPLRQPLRPEFGSIDTPKREKRTKAISWMRGLFS